MGGVGATEGHWRGKEASHRLSLSLVLCIFSVCGENAVCTENGEYSFKCSCIPNYFGGKLLKNCFFKKVFTEF